jgi:hypothetical protein
MNAAEFNAELKTLTVPQLRKLEKLLSHLDRNANCKFDELLAQLASTHFTQSKIDSELIGARAYALTLEGMNFALARNRAQEEFAAGTLKQNIPRYRPQARAVSPNSSTSTPALRTAPPVVAQAPTIPSQPLPTNVIPFKPPPDNVFCGKFFNNNGGNNSVW